MANNIINIKLLSSPPGSGPFTILDTDRNPLIENVSSEDMENGFAMSVGDDDTTVIVVSSGNCKIEQYVPFEDITTDEWADSDFSQSKTGCVWTHLKNTSVYNYYYNNIEPYIIEYPFSYKYHDEILQNVKDYSKVYNYLPAPTGSFDTNRKVQVDNQWFNKAILYNGQQSTGVLNLVPKPENNLSEYLQYPILNTDSKTITYSKTDSFYQYNTFWALQKNDELPLFLTSCKSLSFDKEVNQDNMDYGPRSFKKSTLRAKNLKVRHILDNKSTTHIISQFIVTPSQISYK
tara:strand:- start:145 stop:1014 length:870 start_codon:yes stop_codon:yes gene_type:complete